MNEDRYIYEAMWREPNRVTEDPVPSIGDIVAQEYFEQGVSPPEPLNYFQACEFAIAAYTAFCEFLRRGGLWPDEWSFLGQILAEGVRGDTGALVVFEDHLISIAHAFKEEGVLGNLRPKLTTESAATVSELIDSLAVAVAALTKASTE